MNAYQRILFRFVTSDRRSRSAREYCAALDCRDFIKGWVTVDADDRRISEEAVVFAKANRKEIARRLTDPLVYTPDECPVSIFMAGSPGAGKTEASIEFLNLFESYTVRIDPDLLRAEIPAYTGGNAYLFQHAVSVLVEKLHDQALKQKQSFLLDGTSANFDIVSRNIHRSLRRGRCVLIIYVYQDPALAWTFVTAREQVEGRNIPLSEFVRQYFSARDAVNRLKSEFGHAVTVDVLLKNDKGGTRLYQENVQRVDDHIPEKYDQTSLLRMLKAHEGLK
ncbi:zeta toxin family protein [Pseudomonas petrae]|uniref:zeta toxin family protein n=1 Tax=Pseudomonas petrae TaxID=2912190 RepID=UPI00301B3B35